MLVHRFIQAPGEGKETFPSSQWKLKHPECPQPEVGKWVLSSSCVSQVSELFFHQDPKLLQQVLGGVIHLISDSQGDSVCPSVSPVVLSHIATLLKRHCSSEPRRKWEDPGQNGKSSLRSVIYFPDRRLSVSDGCVCVFVTSLDTKGLTTFRAENSNVREKKTCCFHSSYSH